MSPQKEKTRGSSAAQLKISENAGPRPCSFLVFPFEMRPLPKKKISGVCIWAHQISMRRLSMQGKQQTEPTDDTNHQTVTAKSHDYRNTNSPNLCPPWDTRRGPLSALCCASQQGARHLQGRHVRGLGQEPRRDCLLAPAGIWARVPVHKLDSRLVSLIGNGSPMRIVTNICESASQSRFHTGDGGTDRGPQRCWPGGRRPS